jgi:MOSC domain-containing protein YiiM
VTARLLAVNVVHSIGVDPVGSVGRTAIDKRPVEGSVRLERLGPVGDAVMDRRHHGGHDQAVYAYAREDLDAWERQLDRPLTSGTFGENLTTVGVEVTGAVIGERWRIGGSVLLEVTCPRIPCTTFQAWMGEPHWVRRFTEQGCPGAYLRVLEEGDVRAGDPVDVVERPEHGVTIGEVFRPRQVEPARLEGLLQHPGLTPDLAESVGKALRSTSTAS